MSATTYACLSPQNQFSFKCPIFDAETQMRACVRLRDKVYRGDRLETRRGCQACIKSSMCPAAEMVRRIAFGSQDATDHCASDEPKTGRLPADVLEKIAPVVVQDQYLRQLDVSPGEQAMIASARKRIEEQLQTAPRTQVEARGTRTASSGRPTPRSVAQKPAQRVTEAPAPNTTLINTAAATGDLAAALNAA
jgi:hypothetical protein